MQYIYINLCHNLCRLRFKFCRQISVVKNSKKVKNNAKILAQFQI